MPFQVQPVREGDLLRIVEIRFLNTQHVPYERIMFPKALPP